jgi:hypothetical protein
MALEIDSNGNITMYQGDSGQVVVNGLPTDNDYAVYLEIHDTDRNVMGEVKVYSAQSESVILSLPASLTDLLTVDEDSKKQTYYYGIKTCNVDTGAEDTMLLGDSKIGDLNTITVYPRKVKGL